MECPRTHPAAPSCLVVLCYLAGRVRWSGAVVRSALATAIAGHTYPSPRLPLFSSGDPTLARRVDEELARGFGE
jgi:hypothetical protein